MLGRLLYLRDGELSRLLPFFGLYLLLFAGFALADGLSLTLFIKHVGGRALPLAYGAVAAANLVVIGVYVAWAERFRAATVFRAIMLGIILIFGVAWLGLHQAAAGGSWYGALFVCREIAFVLMLMHFGTFLQDYFTRDELGRVLPMVYSGGRLGGVLGGVLLEWLAEPLGLLHLVGVFIAICGLAVLLIGVIDRVAAPPASEQSRADLPPESETDSPEANARRSYAGFIAFAWRSPLLFWITLTTLFFFVCRWVLNFQYSTFFGDYFDNEEKLAEFIGRYTQIALVAAILVQLLVVNRLIAWLGLRGTQLMYACLLLAGTLACLGEMTITLAIFARFVENELRLGLRNPIYQLIINQFPQELRIRVRAWSFGLVIPAATLLSSVLLGGLTATNFVAWIPLLGVGFGAAYLVGSIGLVRSFREST
jgi:AAA family ATP:ADP antiporter